MKAEASDQRPEVRRDQRPEARRGQRPEVRSQLPVIGDQLPVKTRGMGQRPVVSEEEARGHRPVKSDTFHQQTHPFMASIKYSYQVIESLSTNVSQV